jgi:hypothetical protein
LTKRIEWRADDSCWSRLNTAAGGEGGETVPDDDDLPSLPAGQTRFPALEYARAKLACDVIRDRRVAG